MMNKLRWWIYVIWLSAKWCFQVNLGDLVWYHGRKYVVLNGVRSNSWKLAEWNIFGEPLVLENGNDGWVPRAECKKVKTLSNAIGSFRSGYRFYMTSWYDIWVREGILDWMRSCRIWPLPRRR